MELYDHAYSFGLEVISSDERGEDVTGADLRRALLARLATMTDEEVVQACDGGQPFDSHEIDSAAVRNLMTWSPDEVRLGVWVSKAISASTQKQILTESTLSS